MPSAKVSSTVSQYQISRRRVRMLWIDSVPSVRRQSDEHHGERDGVEGRGDDVGMPTILCRASAAIVPKTATIRTANQ